MEDVVTSYTDLTGKPELPLYGLWDTINASGAIIREVM
jgi:hypothetical protein